MLRGTLDRLVDGAAGALSHLSDVLAHGSERLDRVVAALRPEAPVTKTLFDPDIRQHIDLELPWPWLAKLLSDRSDWDGFHDNEVCALGDVADWEIGHSARTSVAGPLTLESAQEGLLRAGDRPVPVPAWVEEDGLSITDCDATGALLVNRDDAFRLLSAAKIWDRLGLLVVTGHGIPRAPTRRFLHRLQRERELPIYLLDDNDTWGYYVYSLLKRGTLDPEGSVPPLAVEDVRYLGLLAGEGSPANFRAWQPRFDLRLRFLRRYACFASPSWQAELDRFERTRRAVELGGYLAELGAARFVREYLEPKLAQGRWLGGPSTPADSRSRAGG